MSSKIPELFQQDKPLEEILEEVSEYLKQAYSLKAYFCSIYGKRWAFFAGDRHIEIPRNRFELNNKFGLVVESIDHLNEKQWNELYQHIKSNF
ncbi:MAG: hypothetical protein ACOCPM_05060 [Bacteroidales bacterium]